jgi:uncharacterized protein
VFESMAGSFVYQLVFFIAGFIDSIAGGGGLITVPGFTLLLGPGPLAIGTNKVVAVAGTLSAMFVYMRKGHLDFSLAKTFVVGVLLGTMAGAKAADHLPVEWFRIGLTVVAPVVLSVTFYKDALSRVGSTTAKHWSWLLGSGLVVGFYDGVFGPGGGTFMFLFLVWVGGLSLLPALAVAKFANFISASGSLFVFATLDRVSWIEGLTYVPANMIGGLLGATLATKYAARVVRPVLVLVVALLLYRLWIM